MPDLETSLQAEVLARASVVLINATAPMMSGEWLQDRVEWLIANLPNVPVVLIADGGDARITEMIASRPHLQGYIPTSSSMELAEATVRLIAAGGSHVPRTLYASPQSTQPLHQMQPPPHSNPGAWPSAFKLTPRERAVLGLLQRGLPNKIIGHQLDMSQSTVKAHVHNIIAKLNVRNRTEAAMAARVVPLAAPSPNQKGNDGLIDCGDWAAASDAAPKAGPLIRRRTRLNQVRG